MFEQRKNAPPTWINDVIISSLKEKEQGKNQSLLHGLCFVKKVGIDKSREFLYTVYYVYIYYIR